MYYNLVTSLIDVRFPKYTFLPRIWHLDYICKGSNSRWYDRSNKPC